MENDTNDTTGGVETNDATTSNTETTETSATPEASTDPAGAKTASKRGAVKSKTKAAGAATASKRASKKAAAESSGRRLVTATLPKRLVRVQFFQGSKKVAESVAYNSGNTIDKIVAYAKRQLGAEKIGDAKPKPQESKDGGKKWVDVKMPAAQTVNANA